LKTSKSIELSLSLISEDSKILFENAESAAKTDKTVSRFFLHFSSNGTHLTSYFKKFENLCRKMSHFCKFSLQIQSLKFCFVTQIL
jgi:hypothetical protein